MGEGIGWAGARAQPERGGLEGGGGVAPRTGRPARAGGGMEARGPGGLVGSGLAEHLQLLASGARGRAPAAFSPVVGASCLLYLAVASTYLSCARASPLPSPSFPSHPLLWGRASARPEASRGPERGPEGGAAVGRA